MDLNNCVLFRSKLCSNLDFESSNIGFLKSLIYIKQSANWSYGLLWLSGDQMR